MVLQRVSKTHLTLVFIRSDENSCESSWKTRVKGLLKKKSVITLLCYPSLQVSIRVQQLSTLRFKFQTVLTH